MFPICGKHAQYTQIEENEKNYPHIGQSVPKLSVCAVSGLGFGTNGTVYLVEDCPTKTRDTAPRQYAMKRISRKADVDPTRFAKAYKREYKYHARIPRHPNVVKAHAMLETPDAIFLLSEYIGGADFYHFLKNFALFISRDNLLIKTLFLQMLDAVAHIHDNGVYHGDLKPENILCNHMHNCSRLMLTDFGASTDRPFIYHNSGYIHGTSSYLPPECFPGPSGSGCVFPHAIDVWSLGIILFIMCTGGYVPWATAEPGADWRYRLFCSHPDKFFEELSISKKAQNLLKTIWNPKPECRINVHQLRKMVEPMSEFTKYADRITVMRQADRHPVLQTYYWVAGRCKPQAVGEARSSLLSFTKRFKFLRKIDFFRGHNHSEGSPNQKQLKSDFVVNWFRSEEESV